MAAKKKVDRASPPDDDDPQVRMIEEYWQALQQKRLKRNKQALAQFYTKSPAAALLAAITAPSPEQGMPRVMDLACGAGMLPLFACRESAKSTGIPLGDVVRECVVADIDVGALETCRRVLSSLAPPAEPSVYWADSIFDFTWRLGTVSIDPLDIDLVDKANTMFYKENARCAARAPAIADRDSEMHPLGTAHATVDGRCLFVWDDESDQRRPLVDLPSASSPPPQPRTYRQTRL